MSDEQRIQFFDLLHGAVPSFQRAFRCRCSQRLLKSMASMYITSILNHCTQWGIIASCRILTIISAI